MKRYEWNEDTISHFQFTSCYLSYEYILEQVINFIDIECQLEDGDDEDDMAKDLMSKIYK